MANAYMEKADEPTRRLIANAPAGGVLIYIKPAIAPEISSARVAEYKAAAAAALGTVRNILKKSGVKPAQENDLWLAAPLTKPVARKVAASPAVRSLRESPGIYGYRSGRKVDLTR